MNVTFNSIKQTGQSIKNVEDLLSGVDLKKKGDWVYYSKLKRELSYLCGFDSIGISNHNLYVKSEQKLIKLLEV